MNANPRLLCVAMAAACLVLAPFAFAQEAEQARDVENFGAEYASLNDVQKLLIDDIFERFGTIMEREVDPEEAYNGLRLSIRTTFDAVTHALSTSRLTDEETGEDLGTPLELIKRLEAVAGKLKGAGGDQQFRIYVELNPDAVEILNRSAEFKRGADNTIFHKGYPMNYRQQGRGALDPRSPSPSMRRAPTWTWTTGRPSSPTRWSTAT